MTNLRALMPRRVVRGALLRNDGIAVGLVCSSGPRWDLLALAVRASLASTYHRLLLSLDAPLDVYLVDQPPQVAAEIATLAARQERAAHPLQAAVLGEMTDYLIDLAEAGGSRTKLVVWAISSGPATGGTVGLDVSRLMPQLAGAQRGKTLVKPPEQAALRTAAEKARRLADALTQLGGAPPPRLMEAEEIARLLYQLSDPVRAQRYPLSGRLLERVRRVVTSREIDP